MQYHSQEIRSFGFLRLVGNLQKRQSLVRQSRFQASKSKCGKVAFPGSSRVRSCTACGERNRRECAIAFCELRVPDPQRLQGMLAGAQLKRTGFAEGACAALAQICESRTFLPSEEATFHGSSCQPLHHFTQPRNLTTVSPDGSNPWGQATMALSHDITPQTFRTYLDSGMDTESQFSCLHRKEARVGMSRSLWLF